MSAPLIVKPLGTTDFETTWHAMQQFTASRTPETPDELWITEHPPVYTLGLNRKSVRMPWRDDIPLVLTDRGGKITYHGPGQLILYPLLDMQRHGLNIRQLVSLLEESVIALLAQYGIPAQASKEAPGVYVQDAKIASLGLRIKNNYCYHGLSFNINMDLSPFSAIDPCGYAGLQVTQLKDLDLGVPAPIPTQAVSDALVEILVAKLGNTQHA